MNHIYNTLPAIVILLIVVIIGCSRTAKQATDNEKEESGTELALDETYDKVRNGARLILNYDAQSNSFKGTVENTTDETLKQVRVEVHLSNVKELGPTTPADLAPGEKRDVQLTATSTDFDGWTAHPEVGAGEHGHGEEHGEHDSEHESEHDRGGKGEHEKKGEHD
ncbi:MAG: FxLYD domain-containing protein [Candidatus Poribacteria bacterium]|nr:FxLYD domain-containing protein [Candidatus Poribacteria bacterium]